MQPELMHNFTLETISDSLWDNSFLLTTHHSLHYYSPLLKSSIVLNAGEPPSFPGDLLLASDVLSLCVLESGRRDGTGLCGSAQCIDCNRKRGRQTYQCTINCVLPVDRQHLLQCLVSVIGQRSAKIINQLSSNGWARPMIFIHDGREGGRSDGGIMLHKNPYIGFREYNHISTHLLSESLVTHLPCELCSAFLATLRSRPLPWSLLYASNRTLIASPHLKVSP